MRILVAGAGGYVGIPLVTALLADGHRVLAVDRFFFGVKKYGDAVNGMPGVLDTLRADTRSLKPALLETCEAVVDLAGLSNDAAAELDPDLTLKINLEGGQRLGALARKAGVRRYVYASSASVYGTLGTSGEADEGFPVNPLTAYAQAKLRVERFLESEGPPETVILRNATLYGVAPRMRWDLVVNVMTMRAWRDGVIEVRGGGGEFGHAGAQWRPLLHVDDCVQAIVRALTAPTLPGRVYNVGECNLRVRDVAALVALEFPQARVHEVADAPDRRDYRLSFDRWRADSGWKPAWSVCGGIQSVAAALRAGTVRADDPTGYTLQWYRSLIEWERRIGELAIDGKVLG